MYTNYNHNYFNDLFNNLIDSFTTTAPNSFEPLLSYKYTYKDMEDDKGVELLLSLPGFNKKDIKIKIENRKIEVLYDGEEDTWKKKFTKTFRLNEFADPDKVKAEMKNGLLSIKVFRSDEHKIKSISIE